MSEKLDGFFKVLLVFLSSIFFVISILLPNHYLPWLSAYQEFSAFLMLIFIFLFSGILKYKVEFDRISVFVALISIVPIVQYLSGLILFWGDSWVAFVYLGAISISIAAGFNLSVFDFGDNIVVKYIASMLILVSVISVWIALRQWLMFPGSIWVADLKPGARPFANIAQPNNYSTILFLGILGVFYLYESRVLNSFSSFVLAFFIGFGISLAQSRTSLAIYCVFFILYLFFVVKNGKGFFRFGFSSVVFAFVFLFFLWFFIPSISETLMVSGSNLSDRLAALHRLDMYKQFLVALYHEPFWGYGWNQVSVAQSYISLTYPVPIFTQYTHNFILDILIWNGVFLGFFIVIVFGLFFLRATLRSKCISDFFFVAFVFSIFTHAFFEYPHAYAYFLIPLGIGIGFLSRFSGEKVVFSVSYRSVFFVSLVFFSVFVNAWVEYRKAENSSRIMRFEIAKIGSDLGQNYLPNLLMLTQLNAFFEFSMLNPGADIEDQNLDFMRKVALRYPYPSVLFRYGLNLALAGNVDEAIHQFRVLNALHEEKYYSEAIGYLFALSEENPSLLTVINALEE